jgi:hypothetical protein
MTKTQIAITNMAPRYGFQCPYVIPLSTADGRPIKPAFMPLPNKNGYPVISVRMRRLGISMQVQVHQIVAYQKFGDLIFKTRVRHLDNNKLNFSHENLTIGTAMDNYMDNPPELRERLSAIAKNNAKFLRKFTDEQIAEIRLMLDNGHTAPEVARLFGCCKNTIYSIHKGVYYKDSMVGELGQPLGSIANRSVP